MGDDPGPNTTYLNSLGKMRTVAVSVTWLSTAPTALPTSWLGGMMTGHPSRASNGFTMTSTGAPTPTMGTLGVATTFRSFKFPIRRSSAAGGRSHLESECRRPSISPF